VERLRVLIVDDHKVVRLGLMTLLEDMDWLEVVAEAGTSAEAVAAAARHQPHVVIMDIRLPGDSGIEACRAITTQWPNTRVIMLTSYEDDELIIRAVQAGASGYVLKQVGNQQLLDALDAVRQGDALLDPGITRRVLGWMRQVEDDRDRAAFAALSERELQVLAQLAQGKSNREIAGALQLSEITARNHVSSILAKLKLNNRAEAAAYATRHHIIEYLPKHSSSS
jgi:two-component system, NarL family, response regulator DevR